MYESSALHPHVDMPDAACIAELQTTGLVTNSLMH